MKTTMKYILNGFLGMALMLLFAQCTPQNNTTTTTAAPAAANSTASMKIAYVEIDSLLTKYRFCTDLNEMMVRKEENIRTTLNEKAKKLDVAMREFQRKIENNGFVSQESAQQQQSRLIKQQQDLQALQEKLAKELSDENLKNNLQLRDSIKSFIQIYNQSEGYTFIFSNSGFDNLLYADKAYNITEEIVEGLNARYTPAPKK